MRVSADVTLCVLDDDGFAKVFSEPHCHLAHISDLGEVHTAACTDKYVRCRAVLRVRTEDNAPFVHVSFLHANTISPKHPHVKELQ